MKRDDSHRVFGIHAVQSLLERHPESIRKLWLLDARQDERMAILMQQAEAAGIDISLLTRHRLDERVPGAHQGVVAECGPLALASEKELELHWSRFGSAPLVLVLDGITDPRNLGACLRSADAAGADAVLLPKRRSAALNSVARKTASGAAEALFLVSVSNLARRLRWLKQQGVWLIGSDAEATRSYDQADMTQPTALILGSEGKGMRALTREHCDLLVSIPMNGSVASLNVSVATGILLFEACRQRTHNA